MAAVITIAITRPGNGAPIKRMRKADIASILELLLAAVLDGIARRVTVTGEAYGPADREYAKEVGRGDVALVRTGALIRSAEVKAKSGQSGRLSFSTPYAAFLQHGTRRMRARPFLGYTAESAQIVTKAAARAVQRKILRKKGSSRLSAAAFDSALDAEGSALAIDAPAVGLAL